MHTPASLPLRSIVIVASALLLGACTPAPEAQLAVPKPVKTELIGTADSAQHHDSFIGTLRARQRSDLGFEAAGRLVSIAVEVGDRVTAGQVLARLDEAPARWRLEKADAERKAAAAVVAERNAQLQQQEALARDRIISQTALQSARAAHQQARSQLEAADAALATARRDVELARITAPFDGEIVSRLAQPHSDVMAGQAIFQLQAGNALEAVVMLPETVAAALAVGSRAQAISGGQSFPLVLERLSARSDNGSLVQAIFRVQPSARNAAALRSGGVVAVDLPRTKASFASLTLPVTALIQGAKPPQASVFVLDKDDVLQRRTVKTSGDLLPQGRVAISEGLTNGERVVVAGTAFLNEGEKVAVYHAQTVLQGAQR